MYQKIHIRQTFQCISQDVYTILKDIFNEKLTSPPQIGCLELHSLNTNIDFPKRKYGINFWENKSLFIEYASDSGEYIVSYRYRKKY
jgi:hypothetical protein